MRRGREKEEGLAAVNFKLTFSKLDRKGDKIRSSQAIRDMWRVVNWWEEGCGAVTEVLVTNERLL